MKIAFFDTKQYDREFFDAANKKFGYGIQYFEHRLGRDTVDLVVGFDVVCAFVNDAIDRQVIDVLKEHGVKLIALRCAGYNNVDLKAAFGHLHVVRVPAYSPNAVAEHAIALMMSLNRKTHRAYYRTRDGNFAIHGLLGFDMHGKTAGVIGGGKIGECTVDILKGFGMKVVVYDLRPRPEMAIAKGITFVALEELYRVADIITLHCPLTPDTQHLINEKSIAQMKRGVMIINTGRGKLIDTRALIEGLKSGKVGSAGLDVYEEESEYFFEDRSAEVIDDDVLVRLLMFPNVIVTSHQGFFTQEALTCIAETTLDNVRQFFEKNELPNEICYRCSDVCRHKEQKRCF